MALADSTLVPLAGPRSGAAANVEAPSSGGETPGHSSYTSTRRALQIIDRVSRCGEGLTVKALAYELGVSRSTAYHLVRILIEEGYLERIPRQGGYRLGPMVEMLFARSQRSRSGQVEPALCKLARLSNRAAYFAVLSATEEVTVTHTHAPPDRPPLGLWAGFFGPAHALALGKVLIAAGGTPAIDRYIARHELPAFTDKTITDPEQLRAHLYEVRVRGYATEFEEFARNLCFLAFPVNNKRGACLGALGLGTTMTGRAHELGQMIGLARGASGAIATRLSNDGPADGYRRDPN
jgi:IclR family acetate operon transcriptional repressor